LPAVLSGGVTFAAVQESPAAMGLVDLAQLTESRIAVLCGTVPFQLGLPSGGDSMTYSNVTSLFDYHWRSSLRPWAQRVMRTLSARLLPGGTTVELNRDAYVQPGPLERAQAWQILVDIGALTAEQVAEFERFSTATTTRQPELDTASAASAALTSGDRSSGRRHGAVFVGVGGRRLTPARVSQVVARAAQAAGVDVRAHQLTSGVLQ
jgi:phage portal protein BeeE